MIHLTVIFCKLFSAPMIIFFRLEEKNWSKLIFKLKFLMDAMAVLLLGRDWLGNILFMLEVKLFLAKLKTIKKLYLGLLKD